MIQIFVRKYDNTTLVINTNNKETILNIKKEIFKKTKIPIKHQRLCYRFKDLDNSHILKNYRIENESTIYLKYGLLGGGRNIRGGRKHKRAKKDCSKKEKKLDFKMHDQEYGKILKKLGEGRFQTFCYDGKERICKIRGKLRKRCWINDRVSLRAYEGRDIINKYDSEQVRN